MSEFVPNELDLNSVNNGSKFADNRDTVSAEDFNKIIEGVAYADENVDNANQTAGEAKETADDLQKDFSEYKETTDKKIEGKVDKAKENNYTQLYGINNKGRQVMTTMRVASAPNTVAQRDGNGNLIGVTPTEKNHLSTAGYVDDKFAEVKEESDKNISDVKFLLNQLFIGGYEVEDTFSVRETADGLDIIDGAKTKVKKIVGNTVSKDGTLVNATFGGIKSTSADGKKQSELSLAEPVELGRWDTLDVESGKIETKTRKIDIVEMIGNPNVTYSITISATPCLRIALSLYPEANSVEFGDIVSNLYESRNALKNDNSVQLKNFGSATPFVDVREDSLLVYAEDGAVDATASTAKYLEHLTKNGFELCYHTKEIQSTEAVDCPKEYVAYNGGQESIMPNGDECTVTQEYYVNVGGV